jgi:hypothetical protein
MLVYFSESHPRLIIKLHRILYVDVIILILDSKQGYLLHVLW